MTPDLARLSLTELVGELHSRRLSPVEVLDGVLDRIGATAERLNAVVALRDRESLFREARESADTIARGEARPLEGVPFGVKDLEDLAGVVTSNGSVPFRENVAARDSVQVERLRAAGAIPVGKTNTPEFGFTAVTKNLLFGVTRSPWNPERTPGGSSGGSAAAIAAGLLPLATASDGGGSIRIPASFTGCFGLKPTFGRVPRGPSTFWDLGDTACYGPLTRTVADAALVLDQIVGPSPADPTSLPHPGLSYVEALAAPLDGPLRVAYSADLGYAVVQSDVAAAVEDAARVFERLGHRLATVSGGPPFLGREWAALGNFEIAAQLARIFPEREADFGRAFAAAVRAGSKLGPERYGDLARRRAELGAWTTELFERFDLLVTPTVPYDPPPARGPFPEETEGRRQPPFSVASFTIPFNLSGHPAATVRVGLSRAGLPIGMQIVGPRFREDLVLQASAAFERERPWHPRWPS